MIVGKKVLITGGAGFIGSHLCERLSANNEVKSLDNYILGSSAKHVSGVEYIEGDCRDINEVCPGFEPHFVFHFGEYSRVEQSLSEPYKTLENSYSCLPSVLEYCRRIDTKLVYSGSSTKFAMNGNGSELSPYTLAKSLNTTLTKNFCEWFSVRYAICYFYNAYGGRETADGNYATVVAKFKRLFEEGRRTLPVRSPGTQLRNFTHIDDIITGIITVAEHGEGDEFGIGSDEAVSLIELCSYFGLDAEMMEGHASNRTHGELITAKTKSLGWNPRKNLRAHIEEFIAEVSERNK